MGWAGRGGGSRGSLAREGQGPHPLLPDCPSLSRVYGGSDELSDDITQQQLLPGVK